MESYCISVTNIRQKVCCSHDRLSRDDIIHKRETVTHSATDAYISLFSGDTKQVSQEPLHILLLSLSHSLSISHSEPGSTDAPSGLHHISVMNSRSALVFSF